MSNAIAQELFGESEWTLEKLEKITELEREIAEELALDYYPIQIEIITPEQMIDAFTSVGMPIMYQHWSFGKHFLQHERSYQQSGGLAYEIVINSNPSHVYCMETNTVVTQALVIAHAAFGHNSFFKKNYFFQQWTHADAIVDYLVFARGYVNECEEKYGVDALEDVLDACHALSHYGVDRYKRPPRLSLVEEENRQRERAEQYERDLNILWHTIPRKTEEQKKEEKFPKEPEENILYFLEKNAPNLPVWKREIIRIVRKIAQYFYPQRLTKMMNEGFATFVHYYIINRLYEKGFLTEGAMLEFLQFHTNLANQRDLNFYINPYSLVFKMFLDIKRICENPTPEDREWFPELMGVPWVAAVQDAMQNFKDESFILQYLSPKVIRDFRIFSVRDNDKETDLGVTAIHRDDGYRHVRRVLASHFDPGINEPMIEVATVAVKSDRTLALRHHRVNRRPLEKTDTERVLLYTEKLWEFPVELEEEDEEGRVRTLWRIAKGEVVTAPT